MAKRLALLVVLTVLASLGVSGGAAAGPCSRLSFGDVVECAVCLATGEGCLACPPGTGDLCPPPGGL